MERLGCFLQNKESYDSLQPLNIFNEDKPTWKKKEEKELVFLGKTLRLK